jgi:hypothetical protein
MSVEHGSAGVTPQSWNWLMLLCDVGIGAANPIVQVQHRYSTWTMARPNSLQSKIGGRIAASPEYVFLTREFTDLSGRRQVLRALRKIVSEGRLVRLGCGVYGGARR